jgi:predicted GH43/DUF377 family glycosyl hydrolase
LGWPVPSFALKKAEMRTRHGRLCLLLLSAVLAAACGGGDDGAPGAGGGAGAGAGAGGSGGSSGASGAAGTGTGGATGGGAGAAGASGGAAGASPCPGATPPTMVTNVPGADFPAPGGYQGGSTPQLDLDAPDPGFTYNDPHVQKVGAEYWMFASATVNFQFPVKLYRLVSNDGVSWHRDPAQPILDPGASGSFDAGGVETPAVVFFGGQYHLFYTAYPKPIGDPGHDALDYRVGHATSCDGITWTREPNPLVSPSGSTDNDPSNDWYAFIVAEPGPVVLGNTLYLYFTAVGANATLGTSLQVIGVTTSSDGVTWSAPELALEPDQAQYPRIVDPGPPVGGWVGYSTPNAITLDGRVHLFVDVAFDPDEAHWQQIRLHHAVSDDGKTGWQQDAAPFASAGDFPWAKDEVRAPDAFIDGTTLRLYFAGHELDGTPPDHFAVGMFTHELAP